MKTEMEIAVDGLIESAETVVADYRRGEISETRFAVQRMAEEIERIKRIKADG